MAHLIDGTIGVDLTRQVAGTSTDGANAEFTLGSHHAGSDNSTWVYVQAGAAITAFDCVAIDENYQAVAATKALIDAGHTPGFAQAAFDDNDLGWVATKGSNISCRVGISCAADVQLYTTSTAGVLDDTAASQTAIRGVVAVAANTSAVAAVEVIATFPSGTATA